MIRYITRTLVDFTYISVFRRPHNYVVTAVDSASSSQLAIKELLHNLRDKKIWKVLGFAGSMKLSRIGDLVI